MKNLLSLLISFLMLIGLSAQENTFSWPDGKEAAVVLTYDDGLDCHLDVAIPDLDAHGFHGTFYATGNSGSLFNRMNEWRKAVEKGHELGNHTLFHPCIGEGRDWVKKEYDLRNYTVEQIRTELITANTLLSAIDGKKERSFAYTCSDYTTGSGESFKPVIQELFPAARNDGPVPTTVSDIDLHFVPSWGVNEPGGQELIAYVKEAQEKGTVAVFMFHSVGGGYLNVSAEAHRELLDYLKENEDRIWTGNFITVMKYIKAHR